MSKIAIYPGSFDPLTLGHLSVLGRGCSLFDRVIVAVVHNPTKKPFFNQDERMQAAMTAVQEAGLANVEVVAVDHGLLVDAATKLGATAIIKGFRNSADIDYELPMAEVNRDLAGIETVFIPAAIQHGFVSSSLVRQVFELGGDVSGYVPEGVLKMMQEEKR